MAKMKIGQAAGLLALAGLGYLLVTNKEAIGAKFKESFNLGNEEGTNITGSDDSSKNTELSTGDDSSLPNTDKQNTRGDSTWSRLIGLLTGSQPPQQPPQTYYGTALPPPATPQSSSLNFYGRQNTRFYRDLGYSQSTSQAFSQLSPSYNRELTSATSSIYKYPQYINPTGFRGGSKTNTATTHLATQSDINKGRYNFGTSRTSGSQFSNPTPTPTPTTPKPTGNKPNRPSQYEISTGRPKPPQSAAANKILAAYNAYRQGGS